MSFESLKNNRAKKFEDLTKKLQGDGKQFNNSDDRYWKLTTDKAGTGSAVIRFLPPTEGEEDPFVKIFDHGFQGPTGLYYIEKSLTTIGKPDPLGEMNQALWATESKENQEIVRKRKRRLKYHSNIYVVKDPGNPANEGKVFLYAYGIKIYDKIKALLEEDKVNAFDLWDGANFRLRQKMVDKYPNFDGSSFESPAPLFDDDEKMEAIWQQQYKLKELISPDKFKSYDELKRRLNQVLGAGTASQQADEYEREEESIEAPKSQSRAAAASKETDAEDEDDDMSWFSKFRDDDE